MSRVVTRTFAAFAGLAVALGGTALPALAAEAPEALSGVSVSGSGSDSVAPSGVEASSAYLAGYEKDPSGALTSAAGKTTVPRLDCTGPALKGVLQGIGNEQVDGSPTLLAGVLVVCQDGEALYQLAAKSGAVSFASTKQVKPGDKLNLSLSKKQGNITMKVKNLATNEIVEATAAGGDAELLFGSFPLFDSQNGEKLLVPDFGRENFTASKVNGDRLSKPFTKYERKNGRNLQIASGKLDRGKFPVTYKHA